MGDGTIPIHHLFQPVRIGSTEQVEQDLDSYVVHAMSSAPSEIYAVPERKLERHGGFGGKDGQVPIGACQHAGHDGEWMGGAADSRGEDRRAVHEAVHSVREKHQDGILVPHGLQVYEAHERIRLQGEIARDLLDHRGWFRCTRSLILIGVVEEIAQVCIGRLVKYCTENCEDS